MTTLTQNINPDFSEICEDSRAKLLDFFVELQSDLQELEKLDLLIRQYPALSIGEYYLRSTSSDGITFGFPAGQSLNDHPLIAWSRIWNESEAICAVNLSSNETIAYVTVDNLLHSAGSKIHRAFGPSNCPAELNIEERNGKAARLTVPPLAFVIYC